MLKNPGEFFSLQRKSNENFCVATKSAAKERLEIEVINAIELNQNTNQVFRSSVFVTKGLSLQKSAGNRSGREILK